MSADEEFDRFCVDAWPRLVAALTLYCGDVHVAEEIAQEALLRAYQRWATVAALESPAGWAYRVGINLANSLLRRKRAELRARRRLANDRPPALATPEIDVSVRQALATLPAGARAAVVLRYYVGLDATTTATVLGSTPGAVRTMTHRALRQLREQLGDAVPAVPADDTDEAGPVLEVGTDHV
ncbi:MAG: RNA polymerase sigma factor [Acidimicrobiales bacterium]